MEIKDGVYILHEQSEVPMDILFILNTGPIEELPKSLDGFLEMHTMGMENTLSQDLYPYLDSMYRLMETWQAKGKVGVYSKNGNDRSVAMVTYYLMTKYKIPFYKALRYIQRKIKCRKFNANFFRQLGYICPRRKTQ